MECVVIFSVHCILYKLYRDTIHFVTLYNSFYVFGGRTSILSVAKIYGGMSFVNAYATIISIFVAICSIMKEDIQKESIVTMLLHFICEFYFCFTSRFTFDLFFRYFVVFFFRLPFSPSF